MIKYLTSLVAVFTITTVQAQVLSVPEVPKLVIGITIDQLRGDYLELFQSTFGEKGFKRLMNEGLVYQNIKFEYPYLDDASAITTIYTGTTPFYHGVVGNRKYDSKKQEVTNIFTDENFLGNYTQEKVSPNAIKSTTITDELKIASKGQSDIYAFAPQTAQAIASGGHNANGVFWIEEQEGKWASSTFYKDFSWVVDQENKNMGSISALAPQLTWTPLKNPSEYKAFPYTQSPITFQQILGSRETYQLFKQTPYVNETVTDIANKLLTTANLGKRIYPDFLALTYYAGNYAHSEEYSLEIQDLYVRLDKEIEKLLDEVDKKIGLKNVLIFVTSTGYYDFKDDAYNIKINDNKFYSNRCEALLNMYLMAIYGQDRWVDRYHNNQIFLNRELIKQREISLEDIQNKAAEFITEFTGVQDVYTSHQIKHGEWNPIMEFYKNGYVKDSSGDLFIELQPGYKVVNEQDALSKEKVVKDNIIACPVFFLGNNIKPSKIKRTIKATEIAPTISYIMRIRSPNATKDQVLPELF